jgi:hypothetical protein
VSEVVDPRLWNLLAAAILLAEMGILYSLTVWITGILDRKRDAAVDGVQDGRPLSLQHRWQLYFDWLVNAAGLVGLLVYGAFGYVQIARMTDNQGVTWLAYFGAGLAGWGAMMIILAGALSDGILILSALRKEKGRKAH